MQDRVFINHVRARKLLKLFSDEDISKEEYDELMNLLRTCDPQTSDDLRKLILRIQPDSNSVICPKKWREFIKVLSTPSPVCAFLHPNQHIEQLMIEIAENIDIWSYPEKMRDLQHHIPVLHQLIADLRDEGVPPELGPVLQAIITLAKECYAIKKTGALESTAAVSTSMESPLSYFPALPVKRDRGFYKKDTCPTTRHSSRTCTKRSKGHPTLLPGLFTLYCQHGMTN